MGVITSVTGGEPRSLSFANTPLLLFVILVLTTPVLSQQQPDTVVPETSPEDLLPVPIPQPTTDQPTTENITTPELDPSPNIDLSPTQSPTKSPTQFPTQSPIQSPTQSPTQSPIPIPSPSQSPTQSPIPAPVPAPVQTIWPDTKFPNPQLQPQQCGRGSQSSWICDPNGIIKWETAERVEQVLVEIRDTIDKSCTRAGDQVAVALVQQMEIPSGLTPGEYADNFATYLLRNWEVGDSICDNGAVFFLSEVDKQLIIKTGGGLSDALPAYKIGTILEKAHTTIRTGDYDTAVYDVVTDIRDSIEHRKGGLDWYVWLLVGVGSLGLISCLARCGWRLYHRQSLKMRNEEWEECRRRLEFIEQEVKTSRFQVQTCPICLDEYKSQPTTVLSCGHKFCFVCIDTWTLSSRNPTCPVCRVKVTEDEEQEGALSVKRETRFRLESLRHRYPYLVSPSLVNSLVDDPSYTGWTSHHHWQNYQVDRNTPLPPPHRPSYGTLDSAEGSWY